MSNVLETTINRFRLSGKNQWDCNGPLTLTVDQATSRPLHRQSWNIFSSLSPKLKHKYQVYMLGITSLYCQRMTVLEILSASLL
jgi:hypothetical protein